MSIIQYLFKFYYTIFQNFSSLIKSKDDEIDYLNNKINSLNKSNELLKKKNSKLKLEIKQLNGKVKYKNIMSHQFLLNTSLLLLISLLLRRSLPNLISTNLSPAEPLKFLKLSVKEECLTLSNAVLTVTLHLSFIRFILKMCLLAIDEICESVESSFCRVLAKFIKTIVTTNIRSSLVCKSFRSSLILSP